MWYCWILLVCCASVINAIDIYREVEKLEELADPGCTATTGGNAGGACCSFPFKRGGVSYTSCAMEGHHRPWCYTDKEKSKWGNCVIDCTGKTATTGGTGGGACCVFPFTYGGVVYNKCTTAGHHRPWCFTNNNFKWGNCVEKKTNNPWVYKGCYSDFKHKPQIQGNRVEFPKHEVMQKCYERALTFGNRIFAITEGNKCLTEGVRSALYDKNRLGWPEEQAPPSDCPDGKGALNRDSVYEVKPEKMNAPWRNMGCFKDTQNRANQKDDIQKFPRKDVLRKCLTLAQTKFHDYFGVLNGDTCFTDNEPKELVPRITPDFILYQTADNCQDGRGADKQINIYSVEGYGDQIQVLGCWVDSHKRAISGNVVTFNNGDEILTKCEDRAREMGNAVFAIQNKNQCYTEGKNSARYDIYGKSKTDCRFGGLGGVNQNAVYRLTPANRNDKWENHGCYVDKQFDKDKAFEDAFMMVMFKGEKNKAIRTHCRKLALKRGHSYFGLEDGFRCYTGNDIVNIKRYGLAAGCVDGKGGRLMVNVYRVL